MAKDSAEFMIDILDFTENLTFPLHGSSLGLFSSNYNMRLGNIPIRFNSQRVPKCL
jgi:hypothetical protein